MCSSRSGWSHAALVIISHYPNELRAHRWVSNIFLVRILWCLNHQLWLTLEINLHNNNTITVNDMPVSEINHLIISLVPLHYITQYNINTTLALSWIFISSGYQRLFSMLEPRVYRIWLNISCNWKRRISKFWIFCCISNNMYLSQNCCHIFYISSHTMKVRD